MLLSRPAIPQRTIGTGMAQSTRVAALTNHWADEFRGMVVQSQTLFAGKTKEVVS